MSLSTCASLPVLRLLLPGLHKACMAGPDPRVQSPGLIGVPVHDCGGPCPALLLGAPTSSQSQGR